MGAITRGRGVDVTHEPPNSCSSGLSHPLGGARPSSWDRGVTSFWQRLVPTALARAGRRAIRWARAAERRLQAAPVPPPVWIYGLGVAYPLRARIEGEGVGAVRHCEFTTGAFVEPITAWEPVKLPRSGGHPR
jgi:hypothetical protein